MSVNRSPCWIQLYLFWFWSDQCFWASFSFDSVSILFLTMNFSVLDEGSLNQVSQIWFRCSFLCLDWINMWFLALILLAVFSIRLLFASFQQKVVWIVLITRFKDFFFQLWVNHFLFIPPFLLSFYFSYYLVIGQSATDCANYDIEHYKLMSRHSGVIINFDKVAEHA